MSDSRRDPNSGAGPQISFSEIQIKLSNAHRPGASIAERIEMLKVMVQKYERISVGCDSDLRDQLLQLAKDMQAHILDLQLNVENVHRDVGRSPATGEIPLDERGKELRPFEYYVA